MWFQSLKNDWQAHFIEQLQKESKVYQLIPEHLLKHKSSPQEICFIQFESKGNDFIAAVIINSDTRTLANFEPKAVLSAIELGDFYHSVLDNLNEAIGLFEFNAKNQLEIVWLNEKAMKYTHGSEQVTGELVKAFIPSNLHASWLALEDSLEIGRETLSCSFLLDPGAEFKACEIQFYPVQLKRSQKKIQYIATWYNVTKRYQLEVAETQKKQDFYNLVENAPDVIIRYDILGRRTYVNQMFEKVTGLSRESAIGKQPTELAGIGNSAALMQEYVLNTIHTGRAMTQRMMMYGNQDVLSTFEIRFIPEFDKHDAVSGVLLIGRDITQQEEAILKTKTSEMQFRTLVENSPDFICRYNLDCQLQYSNPVLAKLFNCSTEEIIGKTPTELNQMLYRRFGEDVAPQESVLHKHLINIIKTQKSVECEISAPTIKGIVHSYVSLTPEYNSNGEFSSVLVIGRDITELKEYQEQVDFLSKYDSLTGLPNRVSLLEKVSSKVISTSLDSQKLGLLVLGVDHFKNINDSYGYKYGDFVLRALTARLQAIVASSSFIARIGADEFGVLLPSVLNRQVFNNEAERIAKAISKPIRIGDTEILVSVSTGACLFPDDAKELEDVVRYADSALFAAKSSQRGSIRFYSQELTEKALERMDFRNSIRAGIKNKEFCVYLQPKISLETGELMGAEALVRWQHPKRGLIAPDAFIPVAEEMGLISEIDLLVLDELCSYLNCWRSCLAVGQRFAVNLSAVQFNREDLISSIEKIVQHHHCDTSNLEIEITEGVLLVHCEHLENKINELKAMGFTLALDDFGTGYSSLSYLSRYPIDVLKIDRAFVMDMNRSKSSQVLVKTIVSMAQNLNMKVVAEGVEDSDQVALLKEYGVDLAQGFLYSRPIPIHQFAEQYGLPLAKISH
ncbi:EAL and GGDEF domain-containing protein [Marinomonas ostreistagni]|uniref:EAL domain-containing protein n=1 Tax=Marinomonas ostreistagni TaxID=359209 RepID=A0ABS0ZGU9_9GAMM|nr:bifunctional diguanylate cyclase/phosphodiesterase [Marinomonas ostreistagni]MBJ7552518.1 EAL domain-containing protein [Marinomonas ostreistagni]